MKEVFLDIGELGWSLYLSAHMRWMKERGFSVPAVMVLPGRECLYKGITDFIYQVPDEFFEDFDVEKQNRFTLYNVGGAKLREYFDPKLPADCFISKTQPFDCNEYKKVYIGKMVFRPYSYFIDRQSFILDRIYVKKEILVFPRYREFKYFKPRNLSKAFYIHLIHRLCDEFKDCEIMTIGTKRGAYDITEEVKRDNYVNYIDRTSDIQALIDKSQYAMGAIGSQSAPLKLMLLQGVPTFMIGHEQARHTKAENWCGTEAGFYEVDKNAYNEFYDLNCDDKIVEFLRANRGNPITKHTNYAQKGLESVENED